MRLNPNAGGVITRTIAGLPDEQYFQESFNPANTENLMKAATGILDAQPDVFYFNVNGYSGKFYIDKNETNSSKRVKLLNHQDLTITFDSELKTFTLITPDGTTYRFGGGDLEQFVEKSSSYKTCGGDRPMIPEANLLGI
jgi:hypothetical protein